MWGSQTQHQATNPPGSQLSSHNLIANEQSQTLYSISQACSGLHVLKPITTAPYLVEKGCYTYTPSAGIAQHAHDAECVTYNGPDSTLIGRELCVIYWGSREGGVRIVEMNVDDPASSVELSSISYPNSEYTHQGTLDASHRYLFFGDEADEARDGLNTTTHMYDLADVRNPVYLGAWTAGYANTDHNQYMFEKRIFKSDHAMGLRVYDWHPEQTEVQEKLSEPAFFSLVRDNSNPRATLDGAWSNFEFHSASGGVKVVLNTKEGLFVLHVDVPDLTPPFAASGSGGCGGGCIGGIVGGVLGSLLLLLCILWLAGGFSSRGCRSPLASFKTKETSPKVKPSLPA